MSCTDVQEALSALLDKEAASPERLAVDAHLATCARCRSASATLQALRHAVRRLPRETAPYALRTRVHALALRDLGARERAASSFVARLASAFAAPRVRPVTIGLAAMVVFGLGTASIVRTKVVQPQVRLARQLVTDHGSHATDRPFEIVNAGADAVSAYFKDREPVKDLVRSVSADGVRGHLVGGSVCEVCDQTAAHVAFQDAAGHAASVYVLRAADQRTGWGKRTVHEGGAYQVASVKGLSVVTWVGGRARYAVVTSEPTDDALALASRLRGAFED